MSHLLKKLIRGESQCDLMQNICKYLHEVLITDLDKEPKIQQKTPYTVFKSSHRFKSVTFELVHERVDKGIVTYVGVYGFLSTLSTYLAL